MALMTVYHGEYQAVEKPEIRVNRNTKDFGTGFYCEEAFLLSNKSPVFKKVSVSRRIELTFGRSDAK